MGERIAKKVLLLGWDAADWKMMNPLLEKGWMPNLKKLMDNGVSGNLATIRPILSPMLWNSIATGKRADKHGICGFMEPNPDGTGVRPVTSTSRKCKALWNILTQNELRSNVVGWFASDPAEPIHGAIVSDRYQAMCKVREDKRQAKPGLCHPPELADKLMELIVDPSLIDGDSLTPFVPEAKLIDQTRDNRLMQLAMLISRMSSVQAAAHYLMYKDPWDLTAIYFDAIDHFGHAFMPYHPPQMPGVSDEDAKIYKDVMNGVYRFQDLMLEATLQMAGEDATVIIVSDHGFHNDHTRPSTDGMDNPEGWHSPYGMACISGPGIKKNEKLYGATLLDVTPTILSLLGLPVGADMDGRPWLETFDRPAKAHRILSWDSVAGESGQHTEAMREDPVAAAEAIKQLVELGYIEDPGDDAEKAVRSTSRDLKHNLARALDDSKRAHLAIPLWEELSESEEKHQGHYKLCLARAYLGQGDFPAFDRVMRESFNEEQLKSPVLLALLGDAALTQGKTDEALDYFERVREIDPDSPSLLQRMGTIHCRQKNWDAAEVLMKRVLEIEPDSAMAHNALAEVCNARGEYAQAVEHALQAVGLFHQFPHAHRNLGVALAQMGMDEQAILALETSLGMDPQHKATHLWLARLFRREERDVERAAKHEAMAGRVT